MTRRVVCGGGGVADPQAGAGPRWSLLMSLLMRVWCRSPVQRTKIGVRATEGIRWGTRLAYRRAPLTPPSGSVAMMVQVSVSIKFS